MFFFPEGANVKTSEGDEKREFIGKETSKTNQCEEKVNLSLHISDGDTSNFPVNQIHGKKNHEEGI